MKALARFTGIIFFLIGLVAVIGGAFFITRGATAPEPFMPGLFGGPDLSAILTPLRFFVGGSLAMQGLMLLAVGEALWLVAGIVDHTQRSSEHLATLAARGSMTIP